MVTQTFENATELYSSQFVCCLSTSDGKKYTAGLVQNSASGRSTKYVRAAVTQSVAGRQASNNTVPRLTERHFLRKVEPKTGKSKSHMSVVCSKNGKKIKPQCTAAKYMM
jgi:hypothetical protein